MPLTKIKKQCDFWELSCSLVNFMLNLSKVLLRFCRQCVYKSGIVIITVSNCCGIFKEVLSMAKKTSLWALLLVMLVTMLTAGCGGGGGEKKAAPANDKNLSSTPL